MSSKMTFITPLELPWFAAELPAPLPKFTLELAPQPGPVAPPSTIDRRVMVGNADGTYSEVLGPNGPAYSDSSNPGPDKIIVPWDEVLSVEQPSFDKAAERVVVRFGEHYAVEYGYSVNSDVAQTLLFLKERTSIPVPKLYGVTKDPIDFVVVYMEYLPEWKYSSKFLALCIILIDNSPSADAAVAAIEAAWHLKETSSEEQQSGHTMTSAAEEAEH